MEMNGDQPSYERYRTLEIPALLEQLAGASTGTTLGRDKLEILPTFVLVRTAEMVNRQLCATATTVHESSTRIEEKITSLTTALSAATTELQKAGTQSAALGRGLNWLTGVIAVAALISAAATAFYAWETRRQIDLMQQQFQRPIQQPPANTNSSPPKH
jgi:hypothetical protein